MKSSGFSREERLARSSDIDSVFRKGKKYSVDGIKLFILANGMERNRVVFTFPRGYGTAVQRNYSRRLSREAWRILKQRLRAGFDLTILIFPGHDSLTERQNQFLSLAKKSGLLVENR